MLVGGPNPSNTYDCGANAYPSSLPALSYLDDQCSYSTNEITINWNAPLAYISSALQSYQSPGAIDAYTDVVDSSLIFVLFDTDLDETSVNLSLCLLNYN